MNFFTSRRSFLMLSPLSLIGASSLNACVAAHSNTIDHVHMRLRRRLRFSLSFHNPSSKNLGRQLFWCYLPFNSGSQILQDLKVSVPYRLHTDNLGQNILEIEFPVAHSHFQKVVNLEVQVEFLKTSSSQSNLLSSSWLQPERFIETSDLKIIDLARALRSTSDKKTIENIYDWVISNVKYAGYTPDDFGALHALEEKSGDCTEYAYLVVALARVNLIPSRMIGGYLTLNDVSPVPRDYHNWAEVFLTGNWEIVDSQKGHFLPNIGMYTGFEVYRHPSINMMDGAHRYRLNGTLLVNM